MGWPGIRRKLAMIPFLVLAGGALIWFALQNKSNSKPKAGFNPPL